MRTSIMNRYAKGAIAAAAGAVLLLGGAGTFALWNDSTTVDAGSVTSGHLALDDSSLVGHWYHYDPALTVGQYAAQGDLVDTAGAYTVVPGDELIYVATGLGIDAEGGNLHFTVTSSNTSALSGNGFTVSGVSLLDTTGLMPAPTTTTTSSQFQGVNAGVKVYSVDAADGLVQADYTASIRLAFAADGTANQGRSLDLSTTQIDVNQVIAAS
jgi:alternate signal-mediated exported protein